MKITSPAFSQNGDIPVRFTCQGEKISPALMFSDVPKEAKSLALILEDPDTPIGLFVHWVVWNMPPEVNMIPENTPAPGTVGKNDAGVNKFVPPCPPSGRHRYFFKLFALDTVFDSPDMSTKKDLEEAMNGHIIEQAELMAYFSK